MLKANKISFGYRNRLLFKNISFDLNPTQLLHISGPNGAGKTSLMKVLAGLYHPNSGSLHFSNPAAYLREYLSAESNGHFLKCDGYENLMHWTKLRGRKFTRNDADALLQKWQIPKSVLTAAMPVGHYSTGMKRKLAIARVEASGAKLWLLDEPILGLDTQAITIFKGVLAEHLNNDGACVLVTHELGPIAKLVTSTLAIDEAQL